MKTLTLLAAAAAVSSASATYIPANSPMVLTSGRTQVNSDGSLTYDWAGVSLWLTVTNFTYVNVNASIGGSTKLHTLVDGTLGTTIFIGPGIHSYLIAAGLQPYGPTHTLQLYNSLEPCKEDGGPLTVYGFETDGSLLATAPLKHRMEFIGDSITSASGGIATMPPCVETGLTTDHAAGYANYISRALSVNISVVSWSGKGLYKNCCDKPGSPSELMPQYWYQTLGTESYSKTWDHSRFVPDAVGIALGTNDYNGNNNPTAPGFQANFTAAYVSFVETIVTTYLGTASKFLPIFALVGPIDDTYLPGVSDAMTQLIASGYNITLINTMGAERDGCNGHPGRMGHLQMAAAAIPIISGVMGW